MAVATITAVADAAQAEAVATGAPVFLVQHTDFGDDTKLATKVTATVMKSCTHVGLMLVSTEGEKVFVACSVPEALVAGGVKANEWLAAAMAVIGGRGGGKEASAQGQGVGADRVAEVIAAAKAFTASRK